MSDLIFDDLVELATWASAIVKRFICDNGLCGIEDGVAAYYFYSKEGRGVIVKHWNTYWNLVLFGEYNGIKMCKMGDDALDIILRWKTRKEVVDLLGFEGIKRVDIVGEDIWIKGRDKRELLDNLGRLGCYNKRARCFKLPLDSFREVIRLVG